MVDRMTVQVEGLKELNEALKAIGENATKRGQNALRGTANILRDDLIEAAPYRDGADTTKARRTKKGVQARADYGHLRDNIRTTKEKARKAHTIVYQVSTGNAFWGNFLEWGTRKMAARPWMRPVFDRLHNRLLDGLKGELARQIELEARLQARKSRKR